MTWLPDSVNEYGTPVSVMDCDHCPKTVTVCPALPSQEQREAWGTSCLTPECPGYDIARDADIFFEPAFRAGWITREAAS